MSEKSIVRASLYSACGTALIALAGAQANAANYFTEDFESYTDTGVEVADIPTSFTVMTGGFSDLNFHVEDSSLGGSSASVLGTKVLRATDASSSSLSYRTNNAIAFAGATSFYTRFDFAVDNNLSNDQTYRVRFNAGSTNSSVGGGSLLGVSIFAGFNDANGNTVVDPGELIVNVGAESDFNTTTGAYKSVVAGLSRGEKHTVQIYANQHDTTSITYQGPNGMTYTLEKNLYDVWVDGVKGPGRDPASSSADDDSYRFRGENNASNAEVGDSTDLYLFLQNVNTGNSNNVDFDNFVVSDIPEPASLGLLGLGALMLRRRR